MRQRAKPRVPCRAVPYTCHACRAVPCRALSYTRPPQIRLLRVTKNRHGPGDECGVFTMDARGGAGTWSCAAESVTTCGLSRPASLFFTLAPAATRHTTTRPTRRPARRGQPLSPLSGEPPGGCRGEGLSRALEGLSMGSTEKASEGRKGAAFAGCTGLRFASPPAWLPQWPVLARPLPVVHQLIYDDDT